MFGLPDALHQLVSALHAGELGRIRTAAQLVRAAVPADDGDLVAIADGIVAVVAATPPDFVADVLAAQLDNDVAGIALLAGLPVPGEAPPEPTSAPAALPAWVDAAMLAEFVDTQRHGLAEVEELLLDPTHLGEAEQARIARIIHTLKGEAGTVGFEAIQELYHALEDRLGAASPYASAADDALAVKDWVLLAVPTVAAGDPEPPGRAQLVHRLREGAPGDVPPAHEPVHVTASKLKDDPETVALFGEFHDEAMESLSQADEILVSVEGGRLDPEAVGTLFRVFHTIKGLAGFLELNEIGALAHAAESLLDEARDDLRTLTETRLDLLLRATTMTRALLAAARGVLAGTSNATTVPGFEDLYERLVNAKRAGSRVERERPRVSVEAPLPSEHETAAAASATVAETIKVDVGRVDNLLETIGELVIIEAMVTSVMGATPGVSQRGRAQLAQLSKIVRDLQRQGLALRMVPLRGVFQKMNRLVRDLSRKSGKPIRLELAGQDAEMDRSLAERLGDPLVHMMRNAVDHGIESVEARREAGKPDVATLRLSAFHEGGNIIIELSDDGRGLNRDAIVKKATERGLIHDGSQLGDREVWELIFLPGFSTAAKVTELSGRGVGMDVVKKTVEDLRGRIQIHSEPGHGTRFRLVLPLTLAIIEGMLLVVGGRRFVLPTLGILESLRPTAKQIHRFAGGSRVLDVRGDQLPLVDLGELLSVPSVASGDPTQGFIVILDGLNRRFGVIVDDLIGQQQVVIKHIDPAVNVASLFSGAAILSDGQVGLILNPAALRHTESGELNLEAG